MHKQLLLYSSITSRKKCSEVTHYLCLFFLLSCLHAPQYAIAQSAGEDIEPAAIENTPSNETLEREITAEEDPIAGYESGKEERDRYWYEEANNLRVYGSGRLRYRDTGIGGVWGDGGSRVGFKSNWQMLPKRWLIGGLEIGFSLLDSIDQLLDPGSASSKNRDDVFERLAYIGFEGPNVFALAGKNWSTYYKVASFTDRFVSTGASAGGVFNAQTDGGATGTGRANRVLQTRLYVDFFPEHWHIKPFNINLQVQHGEPVPAVDNANYGTALGASLILEMESNISLGIAYNYADIRDPTAPEFKNTGIDGDARALLIGTRWYGENWYLGTIMSRLDNHETTEKLIYFDGTGAEIYGQYRIRGPWWLIGGYNKLSPDSDQSQAGEYNINYSVFGLRYSIDDFRRMFYINVRINNGSNTDGQNIGNIYTIGVRWDLDKTFSWAPLKFRYAR